MPIYEYHCEDCRQLFERWQKTYDPQETVDCPICKGTGHKVISDTSFVLKGGGWYVTDYGNRKNENGKEGASAASSSSADAAPAASACSAGANAPGSPASAVPSVVPSPAGGQASSVATGTTGS